MVRARAAVGDSGGGARGGQLVEFAVSAGGVVVGLLIVASWLWLRPQSNAARRFLIAAALAYTTASIYALPVLGTRLLAFGSHRFSAADVQPARTAIVVFGGGAETVQGWGEQRLSVPNGIEAARVLEALCDWRGDAGHDGLFRNRALLNRRSRQGAVCGRWLDHASDSGVQVKIQEYAAA